MTTLLYSRSQWRQKIQTSCLENLFVTTVAWLCDCCCLGLASLPCYDWDRMIEVKNDRKAVLNKAVLFYSFQ